MIKKITLLCAICALMFTVGCEKTDTIIQIKKEVASPTKEVEEKEAEDIEEGVRIEVEDTKELEEPEEEEKPEVQEESAIRVEDYYSKTVKFSPEMHINDFNAGQFNREKDSNGEYTGICTDFNLFHMPIVFKEFTKDGNTVTVVLEEDQMNWSFDYTSMGIYFDLVDLDTGKIYLGELKEDKSKDPLCLVTITYYDVYTEELGLSMIPRMDKNDDESDALEYDEEGNWQYKSIYDAWYLYTNQANNYLVIYK